MRLCKNIKIYKKSFCKLLQVFAMLYFAYADVLTEFQQKCW